MWTKIDCVWDAVESKSDLKARMIHLGERAFLPVIETSEATTCGILTIPGDDPLLVPICYSNVGIAPSVAISGELIAIGIGSEIVAVNKWSGRQVFRYAMPTVFHQFIPWRGNDLLCMDEIGFVLLSATGEEIWSFLTDVINRFEVKGRAIKGDTIEGDHFEVTIEQ